MKIVFTNGCFDIIHLGHIKLLQKAKALGDYLVVGLNSDVSVKKLKGGDRPYMDEISRRGILEAIKYVDEVVLFDDPSVLETIKKIKPDVLVKGGDYKINEIVGADFVLNYGGEVKIISFLEGHSSTQYIKIKESWKT